MRGRRPPADGDGKARRPTRRQYLHSAAGLGTVALVDGSMADSDELTAPAAEAGTGEREDFLWVHERNWRDGRIRKSEFAFARRHDLAVVFPVRSAAFDAVEGQFRRAVREATGADLDVWIRLGLLTETTAAAFMADDDARRAHLDRLRRVCRVYDELSDGGRVVLWEEAPVMGQWVEGGAWNGEAVQNMTDHGPAIFDEQRRAVRDVTDRPVGIFVHFPYVVDSKSPEVFATLVDDVAERGDPPAFAFLDFYRGWYEKDVGPDAADAAVRSLIANAGEALGGNPVFYLGQAHTINPGHTPSKEAIGSNLRTSLDAGADGLGWYSRTEYVPTERGFDPYVPNEPDAAFEDRVETATVARDRYVYAWLSTLATRPGFDPADRFDLWLWGADLPFEAHRLSARGPDGWEFLRDLDGYADGEYPYGSGAGGGATNGGDGSGSSTEEDVAAVRGLRRDRWLRDGTLELELATRPDGPETTLRGALAMPCDPNAYVAEFEAAALLAGDAPVERFALGATGESTALVPGERRRAVVPVETSNPPSLHGLKHPDSLAAVLRLRSAERRGEVDPDARFDLWVSGRGLADPSAAPSVVDRSGNPRSPAAASVVAKGTDEAALFYGLERDRFLGNGLALADDARAGTAVDAAHAMPYAGSAAFRSPSRAAALVDEQPDEVETFGVASVDRR